MKTRSRGNWELLNPLQCKRRFNYISVQASQSVRADFLRIEAIDEATKSRLYPNVRRSINRYYGGQGFTSVWRFLGAMALMLGLTLVILLPLGGWIAGRLSNNFGAGWFAAAGGITYYLCIFTIPKSSSVRYRLWFLAAYLGTILLFAAATSPLQASLAQQEWLTRASGFLGGGSLVSAFTLSALVGVAPYQFWSAHALRRNTDSRLLIRTVAILNKIEQSPNRWVELPFRIELMGELEAVANMIQRELPAQCTSGDAVFNIWVQQKASRAAAFIREMKKWVIVPREDTREFFTQQLAKLAVCLAGGDWDGIPTAETSVQSRRTRWLAGAFGTIRTVVASVLPVAVLGLMNKYRIPLPDDVKSYAYFGAVIWLAVGFIGLLDPLYAAKFETVKSAFQLFQLSSKKD
jgi:hypothetical protein